MTAPKIPHYLHGDPAAEEWAEAIAESQRDEAEYENDPSGSIADHAADKAERDEDKERGR